MYWKGHFRTKLEDIWETTILTSSKKWQNHGRLIFTSKAANRLPWIIECTSLPNIDAAFWGYSDNVCRKIRYSTACLDQSLDIWSVGPDHHPWIFMQTEKAEDWTTGTKMQPPDIKMCQEQVIWICTLYSVVLLCLSHHDVKEENIFNIALSRP